MKREIFYSLIFLLISIFLFVFFVIPKIKSVSILKSELLQTKKELETSEKYFQDIASMLEELKNYPEEISKINSALPDEPDLPSFFHNFQKLSLQSGILFETISSINFSSEEGKELKKWTVSLGLVGTYNSLKSLISALEMSARLINVEKISISPGKERNNYSIIISFFSY
jgi:Tfp pilus assembly protein PilO